jgi:hypothetical protein
MSEQIKNDEMYKINLGFIGVREITGQELKYRFKLGLAARSYNTPNYDWEAQMWCKCNSKNCYYQHTLPVSWKQRIVNKDIRCFECNRSFFNINNKKTDGLNMALRMLVE